LPRIKSELPEAHGMLDDAEDRLDGLIAQPTVAMTDSYLELLRAPAVG
jgi:hypothetical protein